MADYLQIFNRDILRTYFISEEIRTVIVTDMLDLILNNTYLIFDEKIMKRFGMMSQFMNQEYSNLQFLIEKIDQLECDGLELTDLYDIHNIIIENQELEMICNGSIADYIILNDQTDISFSLETEIIENEAIFHDIRNEIIENNKQIEKIKRMEMW